MEFLVVSETKLKIALTGEECEKYGINTASAEREGAEIRRTLRRILNEAKDAVRFDIGAEKVLVQIYPSSGGGCEMFVTKLSALGERERRTVFKSDSLTTYSKHTSVFKFDCLDDIAAAARAVKSPTGARADVYLADSGEYYLSVEESDVDGYGEFDCLLEFGARLPRMPVDVIAERGRLVVRGAGFEIFSQL